ncbi:hypothetical protein CIG75_19220 [Tumebacillus algifaecis]|uniref:HNH endonuclease n=1 Tax=Tumebacillus algifaecis TaxID=1214604 RepID=A0A223D5N6_9BACL|nr:hypothetical protein [Tumebacillus algifaecis]ASS76865.1 hypothetical protein CIG75_19220 [Tumebacillus algifaecis]
MAEEVRRRAAGQCERCGRNKPNDFAYKLELAHLQGRGQIGRGDQPWNVAALCGPQVNTGTCHNWLDHNRKSTRAWTNAKIDELKTKYDPADWPE